MSLVPPLVRSLLLATLLVAPGLHGAVNATEFAVESELSVPTASPTRVVLPDALVARARPGLPDLRFLDARGAEVPYVVLGSAGTGPLTRPAVSFQTRLEGGSVVAEFQPATAEIVGSVDLVLAGTDFVLNASLEVSADGDAWTTVRENAPVFRLNGADQTRLSFSPGAYAHYRATLRPLSGSLAVPTGALLTRASTGGVAPAESAVVYSVQNYERQTILDVTLTAGRQTLVAVEFTTSAANFSRRVELAELQPREAGLEAIARASGSIYRLRLPGVAVGEQEQLRMDCDLDLQGDRFQLTLENGDSPALEITSLKAWIAPVHAVVAPAVSGPVKAIAGNPDIAAPRYDLAAFAQSMRELPVAAVTWSAVRETPGYRRLDPLAGLRLSGAALDPGAWHHRRSIRIGQAGNQRLDVDAWFLAHARSDLGDVRLLSDGHQVPYLVERTRRQLSLPVRLEEQPTAADSRVSRWRLQVEPSGLPVQELILKTSTAYLQRSVRLVETSRNLRGDEISRPLASATWTRSLGSASDEFSLSFPGRLGTGDLWLEVDNGDNPPITLTAARVTYPLVRLWFRAEDNREITALFGHDSIAAPRYDLHVLGTALLSREPRVATWGPDEDNAPPRRDPWFKSSLTKWIFWGALLGVIGVLLVVVAKMLPKPPPAA